MKSNLPLNQKFGLSPEPGTVVINRLLPGPIDRVWTYLTDPEKRGLWLAPGPMELKTGGNYGLTFNNSELTEHGEETPEKYAGSIGFHFDGKVLQCDPPRLLKITWGGEDDNSEVTFELSERGEDVFLTLTHRKLATRAGQNNVSGGWHTHLAILIAKLEGAEPPPFWSTFLDLERKYSGSQPA